MKTPALVLAAVSAALFAAPALAAPRGLNACDDITVSGAYVLTRNVTATGDCFRIFADNVMLDFDGFTATGDGATGSGIAIQGNGVTVRNGTVTRFGVGITRVSMGPVDVPGTVIERMHVTNMVNFGIGGGGAVVRDSVVTGNGNTGIGLGGGSGNMILNNRVVGNRAGVALGQGGIASGNVVMNNGVSGMVVTCPALVLGNTITGHATNMTMFGAGCTTEHNNIVP